MFYFILSLQKPKKKPHNKSSYGKTNQYDNDMKVMMGELTALKALIEMSVEEEDYKDDTATRAAYAETDQLKDEIEKLKMVIANAYLQEEVDEETTTYLETTLSEVEAEVVEVKKVLEEKVEKAEAETKAIEVEEVIEEEAAANVDEVEEEMIEEKVKKEKASSNVVVEMVLEEKVKKEKAEKIEAAAVETTEKTDRKKKGE